MRSVYIIFFYITFFVVTGYSQWQPDIRLTNANGFSTNSELTSSGSSLHAVWQDTRDGNTEIFYKRSTNEGINWEADVQLTNIPNGKSLPTISATGSSVHIVWYENRTGTNDFEIYYKRSTDMGVTWEADVRLTNSAGVSSYPIIKSEASAVNVIWSDTRSGGSGIYYKRSTDGGNSWSDDTLLNDTTGTSSLASLTTTGSNLHLAWSDYRNDGEYEIYYKRSTNGGISWSADTRLTNELRISESPAITSNSNEVHITWVDLRDSNINSEVYYKRSTDNGSTWGPDTRLTVYAHAMNPAILLSGAIVHLSWHNSTGSEIHYRRSLNSGSSWETGIQLSSSFSGAYQPNIAVTGSKAHIIWHDVRNGSTNSELYYDFNPTGNAIGITNISTEMPEVYILSQNYPNPFNPVTNIQFAIPVAGFVKLTVFDMLGREVENLVNKNMNAGTYLAEWNASNYPSGIFFYRLVSDDFSEVKKMILVK
ncbi:MAG TPA: T9SS type A sorting domain-containing protein [Ignavibacteria bacterium]|nr:hypothetical protein [Bacteroidota bacterium]HRE11331.1 T9SS type A sorting domain-containing protein [Ignavibacteria bacterium]HRF65649.1 T9SS type A sorting domain-containing protein [Ignavibacteria bacterium]HRJ03319.1 T9SS type A sorting domain-containing protein [Ignavibacteria bacterium]HRJ84555.1 T9SS type A sorting domain-containing protein [Ignavibacteria bacterium]